MKKVIVIGSGHIGICSNIFAQKISTMGNQNAPFTVHYTAKKNLQEVEEKSPFFNDNAMIIKNTYREKEVDLSHLKKIKKQPSKKHQARDKNRNKFWK